MVQQESALANTAVWLKGITIQMLLYDKNGGLEICGQANKHDMYIHFCNYS